MSRIDWFWKDLHVMPIKFYFFIIFILRDWTKYNNNVPLFTCFISKLPSVTMQGIFSHNQNNDH